MNELGKFLLQKRLQLGLTTHDAMAKMLGVERSSYLRWENGVSLPREIFLRKMAKAFLLDVQELRSLKAKSRSRWMINRARATQDPLYEEVSFSTEDLAHLARVTELLKEVVPGPHTVTTLLELLRLKQSK
jgi:transcriptional regulator with XRE-family HTH domain